MNHITLRQAATLLVRFFGFYLLFYAALGLLDFPGYWMRSTFSHPHTASHSQLDSSYDVNFVMYWLREGAHVVVGMFLLGQPKKLAEFLTKRIGDDTNKV
jgi:hypothetical protein